MPRPSACRAIQFSGLILIVIVVQISLNILLSISCDVSTQNVRVTRRETEQTDIFQASYAKRVWATKRTIENLRVQLKQATGSTSSAQVDRLRTENAQTTTQTNTQENTTEVYRLRKENERLTAELAKYEKLEKVVSAQEFSKLKSDASNLDFLKGNRVINEYEVVPFDSFVHNAIFSVNKDGLVDRPARRPTGTRIQEQKEILNFAVRVLKDEYPDANIQKENLANGISRLHRLNGMMYDLIFTAGQPNQYRRVKIRRPFSNIELVDSVENLDTSKELINLILPLSGRTGKLEMFLQRFGDICVRWDGKVFLTVVYFGGKGLGKVKTLLSEFEERERFKNYKLILLDEPFSRGVGLQKGVLSWKRGNNIMFFCDVDMYFNPDFLERCRFYTEPGRMVYYPIVYSLYNPDIVYNGRPPSIKQQLYIGKHNGFWRDFGFGMTCIYKNDFVETKGFDTSIHGWGTEDIKLYRKFLQTDLAVIRAVDRGIFHMYHSKNCDPLLPSEQYFSCLHSKAVSEAPPRHMGMLAFGNRLFSNMELNWKTKLQYQPDFSLRDSKTINKLAMNLWKRADEIDIEILEVKQLRDRLAAAMDFTVFGQNVVNVHKVNVSVLRELELGLESATSMVKKLALAFAKNNTNHA